MKIKMKICSGCGEEKVIWKNHEGEKYCQYCWNRIKFNEDPPVPKPRTPINPKSKKQVALDSAYTKLRKIFLIQNQMCQAHLPGCQGGATDVHHTHSGADRSKYYLVVDTWMAVCRSCHNHIHFVDPKGARENGFLK